MFEKEKDPEVIKQKISHKPTDYVKLNKLYEDFGKRFVPQQELSAGEAFWYHMLNPSTKSSNALPVKIEAPKKLSKVSLVNESLNKLKLHLANFDKVSSVDKQCLKIAKKELLLENDRILQQIMCQDVLLTMMKSMSLNGEYVNMERKRNESCDKITSANVVPPKKTTSHSVETQKPELKVYNRKPKKLKNVGSSKKAKIVESKNANHSEPNNAWGYNAIDIPSSSSLIMT
nr:hypothetical protein [Tanacetum cinerariifolium]